jgi:hypothetical protein
VDGEVNPSRSDKDVRRQQLSQRTRIAGGGTARQGAIPRRYPI